MSFFSPVERKNEEPRRGHSISFQPRERKTKIPWAHIFHAFNFANTTRSSQPPKAKPSNGRRFGWRVPMLQRETSTCTREETTKQANEQDDFYCSSSRECLISHRGCRHIPGLYTAGEVAGGIHGGDHLGSCATLDCLSFGRIAGRSVVEEQSQKPAEPCPLHTPMTFSKR